MKTRSATYRFGDAEVTLGIDEVGSGPTIVFLPALSSISTRAEMHPLMGRFAADFRALTIDWPGFGDRARPRVAWTPDMLSAVLSQFLQTTAPRAVIAAGHAATYALHAVAVADGVVDRLALLAPTWRGPFPTMVGGDRPWFARLRAALDQPLVGPLLYRLNVSGPVIKRMVREHVYSDPDWLAGMRKAGKIAVTRAPGARHASVRFVTGALDRVQSRAAFLELARRAGRPILAVYGAETPPKSRAEMEALAEVPNVRLVRLARGKLSVHEEFADDVAALVGPFLRG